MARYEDLRDGVLAEREHYLHLDVAQLIKHAFGPRTAVHREAPFRGKRPILFYLFAEPKRWDGGRGEPVSPNYVEAHRSEIARFAKRIAGDEVVFQACDYRTLLASWKNSNDVAVAGHADAVLKRFDV